MTTQARLIAQKQAEALEEFARTNLNGWELESERGACLDEARSLRAQAEAEQPEGEKGERDNWNERRIEKLRVALKAIGIGNVDDRFQSYANDALDEDDGFRDADRQATRSNQAQAVEGREGESFQARVEPWLDACFGHAIATDTVERNHRFVEEALELSQACGCTASEAHQLVDYVWGRPVGEKTQEVGGVMVTLAALCSAWEIDMAGCGEVELARIWTMVEKIRAKQAAKPKHSPLAEATPPTQQEALAPQDRLSRHADIVLEAIQEYDASMLEDDFNAQACLDKIIKRMRERFSASDATPSPQAVPEGFVLVPREPTEEMADTFLHSWLSAKKVAGFIKTDDDLEALVIAALRDAIASAPPAPAKDGWISVEERLPEIDTYYLACIKPILGDAFLSINYFAKQKNPAISGWTTNKVTHWHELPLPPKE